MAVIKQNPVRAKVLSADIEHRLVNIEAEMMRFLSIGRTEEYGEAGEFMASRPLTTGEVTHLCGGIQEIRDRLENIRILRG